MSSTQTASAPDATIQLARWTVTSGSNVQSRGAVILAAGDRQWEASAEGTGAIDALYRAVDQALRDVLDGQPRLLAYDIHALGEGSDTIGAVTVRVAPPPHEGERGTGEYTGEARGRNIVAASIEAYIGAVNAMLGEAHWSGAAEAAAGGRRVASTEAARARRAELDEDAGEIDTTDWFNR
jgi:LeuA-like protein with dimerisation domain